ncbi:ATP-binding protein [Streptomyces sp. KM273126]|uniref:ATP-binding protein n=1 Tax=Streptomyces sp. KM273126 TaxID=2545247 RepID=UPI001C68496A|nr:ATP-binding protein [Streptomyces sp. KM273126]
MNDDTTRVRLLPWTGAHGQPCLLLTDGDGPASRHADRIENMQLDLADRLLGRTGDALARRGARANGELVALVAQLADALADTLLIARSRGARLAEVPRARLDGTPAVSLLPEQVFPDVPVGTSPAPHAYALLTLPGHDLASAPAARRYVRDTARSWGLSLRTTDDLETIAGELVANALEHTDSGTITVTCARTAGTVTISVIDEGHGPAPVAAHRTPPDPEREHGRGLLITEALADRWGTRETGAGLMVWAEIATDCRATLP